MTANNATQTWEISENGMVYTDEKWGDEEIFVQRKWKRITPLNQRVNKLAELEWLTLRSI